MTRQELETRRLSAIPDLQNGTSMAKLAEQYKVSRVSIYRWKKAIDRGEGLTARKAPGRPPRLNARQAHKAILLWKVGPKILMDAAKWTQALFAEAIAQQMGIEYSPDHMGRIMHRLGLTPLRQRNSQ